MANLKRALAPVIAALISLTGCGRIGYIEVDVGSADQATQDHWGVGEPNDNGREDCAAIYDHPDWMAANHWADTPCDQDLSSICESY
jgi:predicted small lipoprotein YifL